MESLTEDIKRFLAVSSGSGSGDGYGSGYGNGDGDGYCNDSGSGNGYGSGSGNGYGNGYGDGYGYGYGDGDIKTLNGQAVYYIDGVPTIIESVRGNYAKGYIVKEDLTLVPCCIARVENSFAHGETLKDAVRDAKNKALEEKTTEGRIDMFLSEFPTLMEKHTGREFYDWHHILTGSCTMGRDEFCKAHNVQMDAEYTVEYFLDLVSDSYGRDVIKQVRGRY